MSLRLFALALLLGSASTMSYAEVTLHVGDPAPALEVATWVKGDKVEKLDPEKNYVVELWATWCGPCKMSIPHLTELATQYKDKFTFIGVSINERDESKVAPFVADMGDKMGYAVAIDAKDPGIGGDSGRMARTWFTASGQSGIPVAYVVVKGKIAWIGHPMQLDKPLEEIDAGKFDIEKAAQDYRDELSLEAPREALAVKLRAAMSTKDYGAAIAAIDESVAAHPKLQDSFGGLKFQFMLAKKDYAAASAYAATIVDKTDSPELLNHIAWSIVDPDEARRVDPANRDLALARKAADRAVELSKGDNPMILDTQALVLWEQGEKARALEIQEKAVKLAGEGGAGDEVEAELKTRLEMYRKGTTESK